MDFDNFGGRNPQDGMDAFADIAGQYESKNENELMSELLRVTAEQKASGSFDAEGCAAPPRASCRCSHPRRRKS